MGDRLLVTGGRSSTKGVLRLVVVDAHVGFFSDGFLQQLSADTRSLFFFPHLVFFQKAILWLFAAGKLNIVTYGVEMALCHFLTCSSRVAWV